MQTPSRHERLLTVSESWKMFDEISATYDRVNRILSFGKDKGWRKKVALHLPPLKSLDVLDLATGTGDQLFALLEAKVPLKSAFGLDLAEEMLNIAKKKPFADKFTWRKGDAQQIPFPEKSFDAVTFSFGIRNVPDPFRSLLEIHRVLRKKGRCLILEFSLPPKPIRFFYLLYLRHILPFLGGLLSKSTPSYRYLNETIETFPSGDAFALLMKKAGFKSLSLHPMALGAVTLYVGEK